MRGTEKRGRVDSCVIAGPGEVGFLLFMCHSEDKDLYQIGLTVTGE